MYYLIFIRIDMEEKLMTDATKPIDINRSASARFGFRCGVTTLPKSPQGI